MEEVTRNSNAATKDRFGIEIQDVRIKRADLPQEISKSVHERMSAERRKIAQQYRSEGRAENRKIEGQKELEQKTIISEAYRKAQEAKGEGDAQSLKILADAFQKDENFYSLMKSLEVYKKSFGGNSKLILSTDSDLMKYLKGSKQ